MLGLIILSVVYAACAVVFFRALAVAPRGYEDDGGFHYGDEPSRDEYIDRPLVFPERKPDPQEQPSTEQDVRRR